jgi:TRAP-type mannitol/chloroaromatic compound transport system substrate-binding protein
MAFLLVSCGETVNEATTHSSTANQETFEWKLVTTWPKNYPGLGLAPENFAKQVEAMSGGRLKIKVFGAGQLVPAFEVFDAVSQGTAQMGHGKQHQTPQKLALADPHQILLSLSGLHSSPQLV